MLRCCLTRFAPDRCSSVRLKFLPNDRALTSEVAAPLPPLKHYELPRVGRRRRGNRQLNGMQGARLRDYTAVGVTEICPIFYSPDAAGALRGCLPAKWFQP